MDSPRQAPMKFAGDSAGLAVCVGLGVWAGLPAWAMAQAPNRQGANSLRMSFLLMIIEGARSATEVSPIDDIRQSLQKDPSVDKEKRLKNRSPCPVLGLDFWRAFMAEGEIMNRNMRRF